MAGDPVPEQGVAEQPESTRFTGRAAVPQRAEEAPSVMEAITAEPSYAEPDDLASEAPTRGEKRAGKWRTRYHEHKAAVLYKPDRWWLTRPLAPAWGRAFGRATGEAIWSGLKTAVRVPTEKLVLNPARRVEHAAEFTKQIKSLIDTYRATHDTSDFHVQTYQERRLAKIAVDCSTLVIPDGQELGTKEQLRMIQFQVALLSRELAARGLTKADRLSSEEKQELRDRTTVIVTDNGNTLTAVIGSQYEGVYIDEKTGLLTMITPEQYVPEINPATGRPMVDVRGRPIARSQRDPRNLNRSIPEMQEVDGRASVTRVSFKTEEGRTLRGEPAGKIQKAEIMMADRDGAPIISRMTVGKGARSTGEVFSDAVRSTVDLVYSRLDGDAFRLDFGRSGDPEAERNVRTRIFKARAFASEKGLEDQTTYGGLNADKLTVKDRRKGLLSVGGIEHAWQVETPDRKGEGQQLTILMEPGQAQQFALLSREQQRALLARPDESGNVLLPEGYNYDLLPARIVLPGEEVDALDPSLALDKLSDSVAAELIGRSSKQRVLTEQILEPDMDPDKLRKLLGGVTDPSIELLALLRGTPGFEPKDANSAMDRANRALDELRRTFVGEAEKLAGRTRVQVATEIIKRRFALEGNESKTINELIDRVAQRLGKKEQHELQAEIRQLWRDREAPRTLDGKPVPYDAVVADWASILPGDPDDNRAAIEGLYPRKDYPVEVMTPELGLAFFADPDNYPKLELKDNAEAHKALDERPEFADLRNNPKLLALAEARIDDIMRIQAKPEQVVTAVLESVLAGDKIPDKEDVAQLLREARLDVEELPVADGDKDAAIRLLSRLRDVVDAGRTRELEIPAQLATKTYQQGVQFLAERGITDPTVVDTLIRTYGLKTRKDAVRAASGPAGPLPTPIVDTEAT